ncbi:argininosuccinate synthase [bacterium (Candidatus Torokbacteria) CG_4_10_14_0_2_um_filter_35_8]|nr:MAG: argininosuccinate synthase [bacterium (Candidatus Torokbacteria) CG_4_10_14_0_2_um_filter_35_8]
MNKYTKVSSYEAKKGEVKKVVLLYSGGLDTSVMLKWIQDEYKAKVIALTIDIGQQADDLTAIRKKALKVGAYRAYVIDAKDEFAEEYISKGIKANASYQGPYHLSTPLGRPLLAKKAVEIAAKEKADAIAHGCTGKGNDQVRLESTALTLNPDIKVIAPVREWSMGRDEELVYAKKHGIPVKQTAESPYSYDDNMWGVTGESGEIENPALIPPLEKILQVCTLPEKAPNKPEYVKLEFVKGIPVSINGQKMKLADLIIKLNKIGARHGVGITHHIEDRVVGLKVRGVYEAPAAEIIINAHWNLEKYVCTRVENEFKATVDQKFAYICYGALWYDPLMQDINAFIDKVNEKVTGKVIVKLYKGKAETVALDTPNTIFDEKLATFMKSEAFNQNCSAGFIEIYSLQMRLAKRVEKNILLSIGHISNKKRLLPYIKNLAATEKFKLYATEKTHKFLRRNKVDTTLVHKISNLQSEPNIKHYLDEKRFDLIINIPAQEGKRQEVTDGKVIRKSAVENDIPLITEPSVSEDFIEKLV